VCCSGPDVLAASPLRPERLAFRSEDLGRDGLPDSAEDWWCTCALCRWLFLLDRDFLPDFRFGSARLDFNSTGSASSAVASLSDAGGGEGVLDSSPMRSGDNGGVGVFDSSLVRSGEIEEEYDDDDDLDEDDGDTDGDDDAAPPPERFPSRELFRFRPSMLSRR